MPGLGARWRWWLNMNERGLKPTALISLPLETCDIVVRLDILVSVFFVEEITLVNDNTNAIYYIYLTNVPDYDGPTLCISSCLFHDTRRQSAGFDAIRR